MATLIGFIGSDGKPFYHFIIDLFDLSAGFYHADWFSQYFWKSPEILPFLFNNETVFIMRKYWWVNIKYHHISYGVPQGLILGQLNFFTILPESQIIQQDNVILFTAVHVINT